MATSRVRRARQSEDAVAKFLHPYGWTEAERVPAGLPGEDIIKGIPGVSIEVKARRDFNPTAWYRQAKKNAGEALPLVVVRPDGAGLETVRFWPTFTTLENQIELLKEAGYQ